MKLTRANGKIILRNNDFSNAVKALPLFALGIYFLTLFIYRQIYPDNSPLSLNIGGLIFGAAFSIFGGRLMQIQFARAVTLDVTGKTICVETYHFLKKKVHNHKFDAVKYFEASPCGQKEACLDLRFKDGGTIEVAAKSKSKLNDLEYLAQTLNTEVRKTIA